MNTFQRISRTVAAAAVTALGSTGVLAQASWDLDACTSGTKLASGYTNCAGNAAANGTTVNIKAYSASSSTTAFTTASTSINIDPNYIGITSASENTNSPNHAIDNVTGTGGGSPYEMLHLQFSKAVDLTSVTAYWTYSSGNADFQVYRYNYNASVSDPSITSIKPNDINSSGNAAVGTATGGWQLVASQGFGNNQTNILSSFDDNTSYYSSNWLIATKFGGNDDAFKLGNVGAKTVVCGGGNGAGGICGSNQNAPAPATLAMVLLAGAGVFLTRRRRS